MPQQLFTDTGTINAFNNHSTTSTLVTASSPTHSPSCPPGAIDIELEVGDHEVDTIFRDPGPKPVILARSTPPLQVYYITPKNCNLKMKFKMAPISCFIKIMIKALRLRIYHSPSIFMGSLRIKKEFCFMAFQQPSFSKKSEPLHFSTHLLRW